MTISIDRPVSTSPHDVHGVLRRHMLADGYDLVLDLERSHGCMLYDSLRQRELIDLFTCFSTVPLGYNHPGLRTPEFCQRILRAALNKPSNSDLYTVELADFVRTFARTLPEPLRDHLFFVDGGALAVENALKAAFDWKRHHNMRAGRGEAGSKIIHFRDAFHGRSGYTLSLTNTDTRKIAYFPKFEDWPRITNPALAFPVTDEVIGRVERAERVAIAEIEQAVRRFGHDLAGAIIEPIQGEGGDNHFRPEFLHALRRLADEHQFLLIFDEVQTGFGTTGSWWCCEHLGVLPDILCFGKKTQVCGIAASHRLDEVESVFHVPGRINSTWGGNLVDMIRCQRVIEIVEEERLLERAADSGGALLAGLVQLADRYPTVVSNARGRGLFRAFDLSGSELRNTTLKRLRDEGVFALASGSRANRFRPALVFDRTTSGHALERLERVLAAV